MGSSVSFWKSFFSTFDPNMSGYMYMWVILVMGIVALAIAIERSYYIVVRSNVNADKFMMEIRKLVTSGNIKRAIGLAEEGKQKALPYVVLAGLKKVSESETLDFRSIQNAVDEGTFEDAKWVTNRRLNGDEVHASTWDGTGLKLPGHKAGIQRISLYRYQ